MSAEKIRVSFADYGSRIEVYDRSAEDPKARLIGTAVKGGKRDMYKGWYVQVGDRTSATCTNKQEVKSLLRTWAEPIVANVAVAAEGRCVVLTPAADYNWWAPIAAGFLGGALTMAMLLGQAWAFIQRRRADLGGAA